MLITKLERRFEDAAVSLPVGFEKGQVFTPRFLATWGAVLLKEHLGETWSGNLVLSRLRSGLSTHLCGLSLECQGAFAA
jgi:hypothetical protein